MLKDIEIIKKYVDNIEKYSQIIEKNRLNKLASKMKVVKKLYRGSKKGIQVGSKITGKGVIELGKALQRPIVGPAIIGGLGAGALFYPRLKRGVQEKIHKTRHGGYYRY